MRPDSHWIGTPLDFLNREEWWCSTFWRHYTSILYWVIPAGLRWKTTRPIDRLPDVIWPKMPLYMEVLAALPIGAYGAIFVAGWNVEFPTSIELLLWRVASIAVFGYSCAGCLLAFIGNETYFRKLNVKEVENRSHTSEKLGQADHPASKRKTCRTWLSQRLDGIRNNSPAEDPMLYIPLKFWFPSTALCVIYCVVRLYILVEDLVSLRSLPASAYTLVDWTRYLPHL